jgi:hypothetical protein
LHGSPLEEMIAGIGHGPLRRPRASIHVGLICVPLSALAGLGHYFVGLMAELRGQLAVPR